MLFSNRGILVCVSNPYCLPNSCCWVRIVGCPKKRDRLKMYAGYKKDFPTATDISPQEAMELLEKKQVIFVDTRKSAEMKVSMLPNSVSKDEFLKNTSKYQNRMIIGYFTTSYRSGVFAEKMAAKGITIYNLTGGLLACVLEGGKVYDIKGETNRIHVYGKRWNYPAKGYEVVMFGFLEQLF